MRALAANGQLVAMTKAAIAPKIHQALDIHRGLATQVTFNRMVCIDRFADLQHFSIAEILHTAGVINAKLVGDLNRGCAANSVNIGERDNNALVCGDVDPGNTSHLVFLHAPQRIRLTCPASISTLSIIPPIALP